MLTEKEKQEIEELQSSKAVRAARKAYREGHKDKQRLYVLRYYKKKGDKLLGV